MHTYIHTYIHTYTHVSRYVYMYILRFSSIERNKSCANIEQNNIMQNPGQPTNNLVIDQSYKYPCIVVYFHRPSFPFFPVDVMCQTLPSKPQSRHALQFEPASLEAQMYGGIMTKMSSCIART